MILIPDRGTTQERSFSHPECKCYTDALHAHVCFWKTLRHYLVLLVPVQKGFRPGHIIGELVCVDEGFHLSHPAGKVAEVSEEALKPGKTREKAPDVCSGAPTMDDASLKLLLLHSQKSDKPYTL